MLVQVMAVEVDNKHPYKHPSDLIICYANWPHHTEKCASNILHRHIKKLSICIKHITT